MQEGNELESRLKMMKAITFSEERQARLMKKAFITMAEHCRNQQSKYTQYYNMILCFKSFKGIMEYVIMQRQLDMERHQQLQRRQASNIEMQNAMQEQRMSALIQLVQSARKAKYFRSFSQRTRHKLRQKQIHLDRMMALAQKELKQQVSDKNYKTDVLFRPKQAQLDKNYRDRSRSNLLENSRRSVLSAGFSQQQQIKRRFVAIKMLPPKPSITHNEKCEENQSQQPYSSRVPSVIAKLEQRQLAKEPVDMSAHGQTYAKNNPISTPLQSSRVNYSLGSKEIEEKQQTSRGLSLRNKNEFLALLSELKMAEILSMSEIIEQNGKIFKNDKCINEQRYIKQSIKVLERIALIN